MNTPSDKDQQLATRFPALAGLRLADEDWTLLTRQGFVAAERRGNHIHFKLRFRKDGRQVVRYLSDAAAASAVSAELNQLQINRRIRRELRALDQAGRRLLRESTKKLQSLVQSYGLKPHGRNYRLPRCAK
jgi:hypothetical protein